MLAKPDTHRGQVLFHCFIFNLSFWSVFLSYDHVQLFIRVVKHLPELRGSEEERKFTEDSVKKSKFTITNLIKESYF